MCGPGKNRGALWRFDRSEFAYARLREIIPMRLSELGEFGLIRAIQKRTPLTSSGLVIGIGDDAAALKVSASNLLLATTDMLIEGVHFDLAYTDYYSLGWKSASVNLSDIAAMGGVPRTCLTSLGLPSSFSAENVLEIYRGLNTVLRRNATSLAGGDTCSSKKGMIVSVTLLGEAKPKDMVSRSGAMPGDLICVTGTLGDSAAGMEILQKRIKAERSKYQTNGSAFLSSYSSLIERHLRPVPRVAWGRKIACAGCANAMIDISDGLSSDLRHICEQSKTGAIVYADRIPLSLPLLRSVNSLNELPLTYALSGGEDYELLFTVPRSKVKRLKGLSLPVTEIGEVVKGKNIVIQDADGRKRQLASGGFDHFGGGKI